MKANNGFRERIILLSWITGLLLIISLIWYFSQGLQANYILRSVNSVFLNNDETRRLYAYMPQKSKKTGIFGYWYSMRSSNEHMFVFTVFQGGILVPLGAVVSADGTVEEIIPLSAHAMQIFDKLPKSILQTYIRRIETAAGRETL